MMFFGAIYYMVPRLTGAAWASPGLTAGHRVLVVFGVGLSVVTFAVAGLSQGDDLLNARLSMEHIFQSVRLSLLFNSGAQILLLGANLLLLVNFCRTICVRRPWLAATPTIFGQSAKLEAHVS